jgi:hypothetical protein
MVRINIPKEMEATEYSGPAILILDGCTAHNSEHFWDTCLRKNVVAIPVPA